MKLYVKANSDIGYLYIFKHGTGPGTVPRDVVFLKEKDLPNGYTAVWLDRFLKTSELRAYDIPSETEINRYLDRIGYCQKDGDVVPCDEVEACGDIKASSIMASGNNNYTVGHCFSAEFSPMGFSNPEAAIKAWYRKQDDYIGEVYIDCKNSTYRDKLLNWVLDNEAKVRQLDAKYSCMLKVDYLIDCCRKALEGNSKCYPFTDYKSVEACDKVTASEICYRDRDNDDRVVALDVGMSDEDVEEMLAAHPSYYRSTLDRFDDVEACDKVMASDKIHYDTLEYFNMLEGEDLWIPCWCTYWFGYLYGNPVYIRVVKLGRQYVYVNAVPTYDSFIANMSIEDFNRFANKKIKLLLDDIKILDPQMISTKDLMSKLKVNEIDACTNIEATTEPKYFANMVSASNDPELDDNFLIEGYYDNQRRGLAESAETSDVSALNELANEYANKGYYIVVHNLTDGTITEFSADNWFNDIAPDGGAVLFMS